MRGRLPETVRALLAVTCVAVATRGWILGNPVVNIDEQFYLLVGQRTLDGALPYVDIWDRKPIGLFLIYAAAALGPGDGVITYQLLAMAAVAMTGMVLFVVARRVVPFWPALAGACAYPAWLLVFGGIGGQSPVFYNLPMALAGGWALRLVMAGRVRRLGLQGCGIMLLVGLALQIKYAAVFEGVFFGLTLMGIGLVRRWSLLAMGISTLAWMGCALLPTAAALGWYWAGGHGAAFLQANFLSVFNDTTPMAEALGRLAALTFGVSPLLVGAAAAWRGRADMSRSGRRAVAWLTGWAAASYGGILAYGVWNDHYMLPLLLPLCLLVAIGVGAAGWPRRLAGLVIGLGLVGGTARAAVDMAINGDAGEIARLAAMVRPELRGGCLYVNEELSALYSLTGSCLPGRFVFPQHLALISNQNALGVNQLGELDRLLAARPTVVVINTRPDPYTRPASRQHLLAALARDYRPVGSAPVGDTVYAVFSLRR